MHWIRLGVLVCTFGGNGATGIITSSANSGFGCYRRGISNAEVILGDAWKANMTVLLNSHAVMVYQGKS